MSKSSSKNDQHKFIIRKSLTARQALGYYASITISGDRGMKPLDEKIFESEIDLDEPVVITVTCHAEDETQKPKWPENLYISTHSTQDADNETISFQGLFNCEIVDGYKIHPFDKKRNHFRLRIIRGKKQISVGPPTDVPTTTITIGDEPPDGIGGK